MLRLEGRLLMDEHWQCLINEAASYLKTDPKKYWKKLLRLRGKSRGSINITANAQPKGRPLLTDREKERSLRQQFAPRFEGKNEDNLAQDSVKDMDKLFSENPDLFKPYPTADFRRFDVACPYTKLIDPPEVQTVIRGGTSKAPGDDGIVKEHLRHLPKIMLVRLAHIFSAFMALGIFPDSMKSALMVFIPKPGKKKCDPANYRPISLLPVLGKIFDKILTNRFTQFMDDNNLHHPHQYGFRGGRGTVTALAMCYEWIARRKARKNTRVTMVARDVKGAFDYLPHRRVKYHLAKIKLPPMLLKCLSSFLDNRTARVKVGSVIGPPFPLNAGTPQGAGPSAALFNLCVRGSPSPDDLMQYWYSYADDTAQLVATVQKRWKTNIHDKAVEAAVKTLNEFEKQEGLLTEPSKTWIMSMGGKVPPVVNVNQHEYKLPPKGVGRLLGHHFTHRSMVAKQAAIQTSRAKSVIHSLWGYKRAKTKIKTHLIKTHVFPHLTYPVVPLNTATNYQLKGMQAAQNEAIRFALGVRWYDFVSAKQLHTGFRYKFEPLNRVIYWRAKKMWEKISKGTGADLTQYEDLRNKLEPDPKRDKYHTWFPSSIDRAEGPEPPPMYTYHTKKRAVGP